uniref:SPK domain-containing protein n=1 Tax=Panagrolaimus sp. PS1159 TaxID=55785 RepID=A0AC35GLS3_9BILA
MNFPGYVNLFEVVKKVVNDEIETCRLTKSKTLLMEIKDPLIKYLTTEYYKVANGKFVDHVCELANLDQIFVPTFTKAFLALESIATKMEECRNVIRSQKDQNELDKNYEAYRKLQKEAIKEKSPEPQPSTKTNDVYHDPRPNPYKYSPPKSIFASQEPAVFDNRNDLTSNVYNLDASNGIPQKDITTNYVADEQPSPVTDLSPPRISSQRHSTRPPPMVNKRKRVGFHESTRDNEGAARGKYLEAATVTLATPLSEHVAVDQKLVLEINSCTNALAAFPNQPSPITTPSRIVYENWQRNVTNENMDEEFEEDVIEILQQFRYNNRKKGQKLKLHLVIKDSLLFPTNFTKKYRQCLEIDAKYPQKMEVIIATMENEISNMKNDYFMKNVIFSMGFDLLCYEPNIDNAIKKLLYFLQNFVEVLRAAFDPSGPKRFKSIIEIYDWELEAHDYGQCHRADLESRFKVLTTALCEKHQMFIVEQQPNSQ